jgi:hypothetical protein
VRYRSSSSLGQADPTLAKQSADTAQSLSRSTLQKGKHQHGLFMGYTWRSSACQMTWERLAPDGNDNMHDKEQE